jgi:predicted nucleic acid-binding protein
LILADSSIWIDHFRSPNLELMLLLDGEQIWCHPAVIGELACGNLADRAGKLTLMRNLDRAPVADHLEVLGFLDTHRLMGRGIGYIDVQLLTSAAMQPGLLWTRDRRLKQAAESLGLSY